MWTRVKLNRGKQWRTLSRVPEAVPQTSSSQKVFTFSKNTSGRLLLEFLWWTASGKMVKWQKSNGEHFQMFQKQSPSDVLLKRCLSFLKSTSGNMLLEFLKNRYIVSRALLFLFPSQKNSLLLYKNLEK